MNAVALRALLVLIAVLGAMTGADPGAPGSRCRVAWTASSQDRSASDEDRGWQVRAILSEPVPASFSGTGKPGDGPCSAGERLDRIPWPRPAAPVLDPRRRGAFAPGERPAALAFLRANGSANANGAGT